MAPERGPRAEDAGGVLEGRQVGRERVGVGAALPVLVGQGRAAGDLGDGAAYALALKSTVDLGLMACGEEAVREGEEGETWDGVAGPFVSVSAGRWSATGLAGATALELGVGGRGGLTVQVVY